MRGVTQTADGVDGHVMRNGRAETETARWLIGADGARSETRGASDIEFEGFTWPERFLVVSTPFDFHGVIDDLVCVNYVADPQRWHFLLQIPGLWRVMFPIAADESDARALSSDFAQSLMARGRARASTATRSRTRRSIACISASRRPSARAARS